MDVVPGGLPARVLGVGLPSPSVLAVWLPASELAPSSGDGQLLIDEAAALATLAAQLERLLVVRGTTDGLEAIATAVGVMLPLLLTPGRGVVGPGLLSDESPLRRTGMNGVRPTPFTPSDGEGVFCSSSIPIPTLNPADDVGWFKRLPGETTSRIINT